jgi:hypothetical protein
MAAGFTDSMIPRSSMVMIPSTAVCKMALSRNYAKPDCVR